MVLYSQIYIYIVTWRCIASSDAVCVCRFVQGCRHSEVVPVPQCHAQHQTRMPATKRSISIYRNRITMNKIQGLAPL